MTTELQASEKLCRALRMLEFDLAGDRKSMKQNQRERKMTIARERLEGKGTYLQPLAMKKTGDPSMDQWR